MSDSPRWMLRCPKCDHLMPAHADHVTSVEGKTMGKRVQSRCRKCQKTVLAGLEPGPGHESAGEPAPDAAPPAE